MPRLSPISARRLRVALQAPAGVADSLGGVTRSFVTIATLWARLEPVRAGERAEAQRAEGAATHRLTLRWRGDIGPAARFVSGDRRFGVLAVFDPDGRRRDLVCLVEEVQE